ncbi:MAG: SigE family RNA polymerase sigma factor [Euzebyaceae bacterium]|nr:SigE family RNA polymerase sigma factor [Euzebyaceae bacterium]
MRTEALALTRVADSNDFAELYATHHAEALKLAYLLCGDPHRAEDAVAEVFAKVYRRARRHTVQQPRAYIRRAVVNEMNSRFRRLALERREAGRRSGDDRGARGVEEQHADADVVFTALHLLPRRQRTAVVLRYYADLSEADTAAVMGVSVGTVKSSVFRGLERMRAVLGQEEV